MVGLCVLEFNDGRKSAGYKQTALTTVDRTMHSLSSSVLPPTFSCTHRYR